MFETRLDRMTMTEAIKMGEDGLLTISEVRRLAKLDRYAQGLNR